MRPMFDPDNEELKEILAAMLSENVDITARAIGRRHSVLRDPSAFTRNRKRLELVRYAQQRQSIARQAQARPKASKLEVLAAGLKQRDNDIVKLQSKVDALAASYAAGIRAVQASGGMRGLERFWRDYKSIADEVRAAGAKVESAPVVDLPPR
jgi:hypothetical protein